MITRVIFTQTVTNIKLIEPDSDFENTLVKQLDTDSNSTSFVIWIKKGVRSHKHETHTEIIYVEEGFRVMTVGNKSFDIKTGDYFRIPKNTAHSLRVLSNTTMKVISIQSPDFLGKDRVFEN